MKKKVFLYTEKWNVGGIEKFLIEVLKKIDKKNLNVKILTSQKESDFYDKIIENNNSLLISILNKKESNPFFRILKNISKYSKTLKEYNIDVIHINIYNSIGLVYAYIAKKSGIKRVILHAHNTGFDNDLFKIKKLLNIIFKAIFSNPADKYFACSEEAAKFCFNRKSEGNVVILKNGIDLDLYECNDEIRRCYRKKLNVDKEIIIGNIARFVNQKNHIFLIEVFKEIKKKNNNFKLLLIGEGPEKNSIKDKIKKEKLEKDSIFLGTRNDIPEIMQAMDIFCLPSLYEGLGIVNIEAQAIGLETYVSSVVPKEVNITENIHFIDLKKGAEFWANEILENLENKKDKNRNTKIKKAGYSISSTVKVLEEYYLKED